MRVAYEGIHRMKLALSSETGWLWRPDLDAQQAISYGRKLMSKLNLASSLHGDDQWFRMSKAWEPEEDAMLLRLKLEFYGNGTVQDVNLCIAWILGRTSTSINTRYRTLIKTKCPSCGH